MPQEDTGYLQAICQSEVHEILKSTRRYKGKYTCCSYSARVLQEQLGDYGRFLDCADFYCKGNIFADLNSLHLKEDITQSQHRVSTHRSQKENDRALARLNMHAFLELYKPLCLSLPINDDVKTLLTSLSTRLTNGYLVTRVIQCPPDPRWPSSSTSTISFCAFVKPIIWRQNPGADSVLEEQSGDETMDDQARDGMEL